MRGPRAHIFFLVDMEFGSFATSGKYTTETSYNNVRNLGLVCAGGPTGWDRFQIFEHCIWKLIACKTEVKLTYSPVKKYCRKRLYIPDPCMNAHS
jgi:hypothetical protein